VVWPILPKLLLIPSPIQLKDVNANLQREKDKLLYTQNELQKAYAEIEQRVNDRTKELLIANKLLQEEIHDRKKAEEAMRISEEYFRNFFEYSSVGKSITHVDGKITTNRAFQQLLDYSEEELNSLHWQELTHPDDILMTQIEMEKIISGSQPSVQFQKRYIHKDGHSVWCDLSSVLQRDQEGNPLYFITSIFDITERKRSEEALFASQKLLQEFTDNSTSHIFALDTEGRFLLINHSLEKALAMPRELLIGKTRDTIMPPAIAAKHRANDLKVINDLQPITVNEENIESDGMHNYISVKFPLLDSRGSMVGIGGISTDITEQKQLENALIENERLLRESQTIAKLGSFVWDLSTGLWKSSDILDDIFGIDENFIRSLEGWIQIVHPDWQAIMTSYVTDEVIGKQKRFDKEYQILRCNDHAVRWVHGNAALEFDSNHNPFQLIGTIIDVTDRKQAEEEIRSLNAELEQRVIDRTMQLEIANKELEAFSYSVSHDLRAPLRHISGFISLFMKSKTSQFTDEELGYLNVVTESAEQMGKLIDALLTFSRLNKSDIQKSPIETIQIIQQGIKLFETYGDYQRIGQVWTNLISNAIKYTGKKEKAVIEIGSYPGDDGSVFYIKDNGAGFNMKYADKLFGVFQRLHKPRDFEGIGIGLANVNRIITRHGGRCWAEGEIDKGATFYFSLPNQ